MTKKMVSAFVALLFGGRQGAPMCGSGIFYSRLFRSLYLLLILPVIVFSFAGLVIVMPFWLANRFLDKLGFDRSY